MSEAMQFYISTLLIYLFIDIMGVLGLNLQFGVAGIPFRPAELHLALEHGQERIVVRSRPGVVPGRLGQAARIIVEYFDGPG